MSLVIITAMGPPDLKGPFAFIPAHPGHLPLWGQAGGVSGLSDTELGILLSPRQRMGFGLWVTVAR